MERVRCVLLPHHERLPADTTARSVTSSVTPCPIAPTVWPVELVLLGVRGSTPAPGPDYVRYGGHTSCVAVLADGAATPTLLMDAGTGIRSLPR